MYYDSYFNSAPTNIGRAMNVRLNESFKKKLFDYFPDKKEIRICEVGYGRGLLADVLCSGNEKKIHYYAIEANRQLAEKGRLKGHKIFEAKIPPFPDDPDWTNFDIFIFSHVVEHFNHYHTILSVLDEARNRLSDDGIMFILFPDYLDYKEDYYSADHSHEYLLTSRRIGYLLRDVQMVVDRRYFTRACFFWPFSMFIFPFHIVMKFFAGLLWSLTNNDMFFKIKITFARNIAVIAKKDQKSDN